MVLVMFRQFDLNHTSLLESYVYLVDYSRLWFYSKWVSIY